MAHSKADLSPRPKRYIARGGASHRVRIRRRRNPLLMLGINSGSKVALRSRGDIERQLAHVLLDRFL
jgi:hypothetical protein